ncbi:GNAT family N-acetyltransferase [Arthrobacter sp. NPDC058288]|uniref:GNAT family N-acetyltransferase n=1 Tax=Arthrobacter sp. NPDC058288 TaxID=3346424 RepID=UPI0036EB7E7D
MSPSEPMSPSSPAPLAGRVELLDVTEEILEKLLDVALADAAADDVTPPLGAAAGWNAERISWFRDYHRAAAAGLDGPAAEKAWAISCGGRLAGSIRLKRTGTAAGAASTLETGLWLGRSFRGRGVGREALNLIRVAALGAGASVLQAETTAGNAAAQSLLRSAGAELAGDGVTTPLTARITL